MVDMTNRCGGRAAMRRTAGAVLAIWLATCARAAAQEASGQPADAGAGAADAGALDAPRIPEPELRAPELIEPVSPDYPAGASTACVVELELTLDASGAVIASSVTNSGGEAFDAAALAAAARLRFTPA